MLHFFHAVLYINAIIRENTCTMKTETTSLLISDDGNHLLIFLKRELAACSGACYEKPAHLGIEGWLKYRSLQLQ
jgi:hypothetical protein